MRTAVLTKVRSAREPNGSRCLICSTLRFLAQEEYRDLAGVDDTGGLHEQVQGSQQERGGNIGGAGKLILLNLVIK